MAFAIRCRDGTIYMIEFSRGDEVQMIEVAPSICQLDQIIYGDAGQRMVPFRMLRNEVLDAGGVYYVGDFTASGSYSVAHRIFYKEIRETWRMGETRDNYAQTTTAMRLTFPSFASVATEDRVAH